jgi:ABC-2 type transport system permease protein
MRFSYFAARNLKEILREPISLILGVLLPVFFIILFSSISKNAPLEIFKPVNIVPGVTIFGFTFTTMFLGVLISKDKSTSFLTRLFISPLTAKDYILGYFVSVVPISLIIALACLFVGVIVGVPVTFSILYTFVIFIPYIVFSSLIGILFGILCTETQVMALGNIYIIASALLGGAWMDLNILGEKIKWFTEILPFSHAIDASRMVLAGNFLGIGKHLLVLGMYIILVFLLSIFFFKQKIKSDHN